MTMAFCKRALVIMVLCGATACAGGSGIIRMDSDKYPVSCTGSVLAADGTVIRPGEMQVVGHLAQAWSQWTLLWTLVPLSRRNRDLGAQLEAAIERAGGNAIVNFHVIIRQDPLWLLSSWIPVLPTRARVEVDGDIVRL